ncbi:MAG: amino acid permease, partial [Chloroflexi bacterium]|nr:amino acid permease [Chloroflexota bacterium]
MPRQFSALGDRLVFQNGILLLAAIAGGLIVVFGGATHALIPLFAVGAFLSFTLSQAGMVVHWMRERGVGWWLKAAANGVGALATGTTLVIIGVSKFTQGAWITFLLLPAVVSAFLRIRAHYRAVGQQLELNGTPSGLSQTHRRLSPVRVVVPVSGVHRGVTDAINFARSISSSVTAVYIELEPGSGQPVREKWQKWWPDVPLVVVPSPFRST